MSITLFIPDLKSREVVYEPIGTEPFIYTALECSIYRWGFAVTKRLIDLDDDLLAAAQQELRTSGVTDTVRLALQQAAARSARARQVAWLRGGGLSAVKRPRDDVWR